MTNYSVRCAETTYVTPNTSCTVPIRSPGLDMHSDYTFRPYFNNALLPAGCYVIRGKVARDQNKILVTNVSEKVQVISTDVRLGLIENRESPQYAALWPSASEEISVMFSGNAELTTKRKMEEETRPKEVQKQPPDKTKNRSQFCLHQPGVRYHGGANQTTGSSLGETRSSVPRQTRPRNRTRKIGFGFHFT